MILDPADMFHADRLRAFVAVARAGGFTRAARRLGRTQSSVSQAVAALEEELGERVFSRQSRAVHLTDAGRVLLARAERAFAELSLARVELAALRDVERGQLVLGTTDTLATYLLPAVFGAFRARYPGVDVKLVNRPSPELAARVADRQLDLAVTALPLPAARGQALDVAAVAAYREVAIVSPAHPLATRRRVSLAGLAEHPLVLLDPTTATRARIDARFAALGVAPRVAMEMSSVEVLKRLVELEFGASIVPAMAAQREIDAGTVVALELRGLGPARSVGIVTVSGGPTTHAARAFVDVARSELTS